jgi:hypothetical protein
VGGGSTKTLKWMKKFLQVATAKAQSLLLGKRKAQDSIKIFLLYGERGLGDEKREL